MAPNVIVRAGNVRWWRAWISVTDMADFVEDFVKLRVVSMYRTKSVIEDSA